MRHPLLYSSPRSMDVMDAFAGYNHNTRIAPGEFYDMQNLTSDQAPVLATRVPRGIVSTSGNFQGLAAKDGLCYVDGTDLMINGHRLPMNLSVEPAMCPKQLISMGAYLIIMPDGKYVNTVDTSDSGDISAKFTSSAPVTLTPCKLDGTELRAEYTQATTPENPQDKALWIDTSTEPHTIKEYAKATGIWVAIATTYVKIGCPGIGTFFKQWDGIKISGLKTATATYSTLSDQVGALDGAAIVYARGNDFITIVGLIDTKETVEQAITVSREMPLMDYVTESENRLWGCRYGPNREGEIVNEIYCCKLGDFRNWYCFMGISTDSYIVSLGSDGVFTGAATLGGHPIFLKENCIHTIYGQMPANFQVQTVVGRGVQKGCERSLAIVNEILYYKSQHGICAYDGALPQEVSKQLGNETYGKAVGAAIGNKYYVSMQDLAGKWALFVYDTARGMWHKEDDTQAYLLCPCKDDLFCVDGKGRLLSLLGTTGDKEPSSIPWMAETGIIGASDPGNKYLCKIGIRLVLEPGSSLSVYVQYDSTGPWENLATVQGMNLRSFVYPIIPQRCDHLRIRLQGVGKALIFAINKEMAQGSDY